MSTQSIDIDTLAERLSAQTTERRLLVALVGAPGSGKSTVAERLVSQLHRSKADCAALLPMDGYHYDNILLTELGRLARKGAPDTFDVGGLRHMLLRLRENTDETVAIPVFDRSIEIARAGAGRISQQARIIVVEGNYLLLDLSPWSALAPFFDLTVSIRVTEAQLRWRLNERWRRQGISPPDIPSKVEANDLPNARTVLAHSLPADFVLET